MSYLLGIDLGATTVTAAVRPLSGGGGAVHELPAVIVTTPAGDLLCGTAAHRRAPADPDRVARGFLARVGDPTPLSLGGVPHHAEDLCARLVRYLVDEVASRRGALPARIGLTHPVSWGRHKRDLLAAALDRIGLTVSLVAAPQAVALAHRTGAPGSRPLAVVDLGGNGATATVLAPAAAGVLPSITAPTAAADAGGADVDDAVFDFVRRATPDLAAAFDALDVEDPAVLAALTVLRDACRSAKELLSSDTVATVRVELPGIRTTVRIHRSDLDELARPVLDPVADLVEAALAEAPEAEVLLAGGTARMPMAVQVLSAALGRPLSVAADPVLDAARGAALAVAPGAGTSWPGTRIAPVPGGIAQQRVPAPRGPEPVPRHDPAPGAAVGLLGAPTGPLPSVRTHRVPGRPRHAAAPSAAADPERPALDTLVTQDTGTAPVVPRTAARQRLLLGAGGVAGAALIAGALLFWPSTQSSIGELSAAPALPSTSVPTPAPVAPPPGTTAPVGAAQVGATPGDTTNSQEATTPRGSTGSGPAAPRAADATVAGRSGAAGPATATAPGTTAPARPGSATPGAGTSAPVVPPPVPTPTTPVQDTPAPPPPATSDQTTPDPTDSAASSAPAPTEGAGETTPATPVTPVPTAASEAVA